MLIPELLSDDFTLARQLRRDGQLSQAAQQYFKDIRNCINEGGEQSRQMIVDLVAELLQCLEVVEPSDVPALACDCLRLLYRLQPKFSRTSQTYRSLSSTLQRLLIAHPGIPQGVNLYLVVLALEDQDINLELHTALGLSLTRIRNQSFTKDTRIEAQYRICLLALACNLRECLKGDSWVGEVSALKTTTWKLLEMEKLLHSGLFKLSRLNNIAYPLYRFDYARLNVQSVPSGYSLLEPSITKIAETCSLNGWGYEAELLFAILRSTQSSNNVPNIQKFKTSITYCLHLEREKRYEKLLDLLSLLYKDLEDFSRWFWADRKYGYDTLKKDEGFLRKAEFDIANILSRVSGRLGQGISSEMALEITKSRRLFQAVQRGILTSKREDRVFEAVRRGILASKREYNENHVVAQENRAETEDDDDQMDDCTSSLRFGLTYTESVITGISFDYSHLYK